MSRKTTVKKRMQHLDITLKQIAHYCVLSEEVLELWLDTKAVIPYSSLLRIAHLLDLEPDDLVKLVFLDIETNGLDVEMHIPVEISLIITDGDCTQVECEYTSLIRPMPFRESDFNKVSSPEAMKVNGITYSMLVDKGKLPTQVRFEIEDLFVKHRIFRGEAVFICQNPSFDRAFINKLFWHENMEELKWPYHWLDLASMYWIKYFGSCYPLPSKVSLSKDSIAHSLGLPPEEKPHRALNGVKHLMLCYAKMRGINCFINEPDLTS